MAGLALLPGEIVHAAEQLKFGAPPAWVRQQAIPDSKPTDAPVAMLLNDQQIAFEPGKITSYAELAFRIQNAQGLAAGNLSIAWQPSTDTVTVNKLQIRRGDKIIDVLAAGQTFQTLRRETNLDAAMLDGTLTANIQPEGLQEGDIVDLATTTERSDPVLKGHVEALFAGWNGVPIELGHASVSWPKSTNLTVRRSDGLPQPRTGGSGDRTTIELTATKIQPLIPPRGAPQRFKIGRIAETSDFKAWSDLADLFMPLYRDAAVIPASGPLHDEVARIAASTTDPKQRAERALALVQDRIRYVALLMGQGGYVPASAETTWSRRFGDCKAKTALLLGILHSLGINSEPVAVNPAIGDAIGDRLPMVQLFNHVLVRAHIGGKAYWLDGTRTGDTSLDAIEIPDFGWGLPLVRNASLVHIVPAPLTVPAHETIAEIDATGGIYAPAPTSVQEVLRGDLAVVFNTGLSALTEMQRQEFFRAYFKKTFDDVTVASSSFAFDKNKRELRLSMKGDTKLDWTGGYFQVPSSSVGYSPDFDRSAGLLHDAPFAVDFPGYSHTTTIVRLPKGFFPAYSFKPPADVQETLAGVEYRRSSTRTADVLKVETSARSLVPEVPYKDALSAKSRLQALSNEQVSLRLPGSYRASQKDVTALTQEEPASADAFFDRGVMYLTAQEYDKALADFTDSMRLGRKDVWVFANRGVSYVWKGDLAAAEKDIKAAEAFDSDNPVAARARGLLAERNGDYKSAIAAYTKSLQKDPASSFAIGHRATVRHFDGDDAGALVDSEAALAKDPAWMDLRVMRANIFYLRGDRSSVAREAELVTQQNPQSNYAFVVAGKIYSRLGDSAAAMKAFDRALAIKPEAYVYINRSQVRPSADLAARIADLDAALKLDAESSEALAEKARLLSRTGDYQQALALLDRIKPHPNDDFVELQRAVVLYKAGRKADAEKLFEARRKAAKTAVEFNNLCWTKATNDVDLESALQDCRDALKQSPDAGAYLDSLGMALLKLGRLDEALAAYDQAIAKKTGAASLMGRAFVNDRKGRHVEARADAAAARKISPDIDSVFDEYGLKFDQASAARSPAH